MPLVRFQLRNEYGLGQPEIYRQIDQEDPKAVLDAAAVAGLVGILRQLGDLSEFAAEVFHGLQEQVMTTVSRSHKLKAHVQRIEAALPPIEKAVLGQTSHIHFAYTAGSEWHPRIRKGQNHFIYNDLPQFIMDSYEECRNPPRLHLLDKFDTGGPGSCLKRYSDPTFFKKASATSDKATTERIRINKNAPRSKKKRSSQGNRKGLHGASRSNSRSRLQFTSLPISGQTSMQTASAVDVASNSELGDHSNSFDSRNGPQFTSHIVDDRASPQIASAVDMTLKPDTGDHSNSFDSRTGSGDTKCVFHPSSMQPEQQESLSSGLMQHNGTPDPVFPDEQTKVIDDNFPGCSLLEKIASSSSCVTWDEKAEIVEANSQQSDREEAPERLSTKSDVDTHAERAVNFTNIDQIHSLLACRNSLEFISNGNQINSIESEPVFPDEQTKAMDHNFPGSSLLEKIGYSSSCVTWDEKVEIVELNGQQSDREEAPEMLSTKSDLDAHKERAVDLANAGQIDSLLDCDYSLELIFNGNQINDTESEPDNYMDALNAIGSESENDLNYQTKRKVERHASNTNEEGINEIYELPENSSDHNHPELDSDIASCSFSNEGVPSYIPNSVSPERVVHEQVPQITKISSNLDFSVDDDFSGDADAHNGSQLESKVTGPSSSALKTSDFRDLSMDKMFSSFYKSDETPADFSGVHSISFWTNGGLLGLEPSKPPAYAMSNAVGQDLVNRSKDDTVCASKHGFMLKGDQHEGKLDMLDKKDGGIEKDPSCVCSTSCQDDQVDSISKTKTFGQFSHADSDAKCENFSMMASKTAVPVSPHMKFISAESNQENDENSSLAFGLSQRLLANCLYKKVSHVHDDNLEPASSMNASGLEQFSGQCRVVNQTIPEKKLGERLGHGSPVDSLTSSPPLDHMKISFHPLNSETSKLKLNFPDANQCFEGIRDMFPSFQLVPEPGIPMNDFGFESDDDTFCRSSPYMSDDCHSHHSASNSEEWESGETPKSKVLEPHDALCGFLSAESISTYQEFGRTINHDIHNQISIADTGNGVEPSLSGSLLELPNFDTVNPALQLVTNEDSNLKLECSGQLIPQPPPLPPVQWRLSKPNSYVIEYKQDDVSDALMHASDLKHFGSAMSQQPKPTPEKQQETNEEAAAIVQMGKQDQQKLNEQKEVNRAMNGKEMDERENFLQQIRSKSFNLRRTMTSKPTNTPGPATDFKVTAILEKANAIRQAIGSDHGDDDDTWSDA